jgi:hypothetical protein
VLSPSPPSSTSLTRGTAREEEHGRHVGRERAGPCQPPSCRLRPVPAVRIYVGMAQQLNSEIPK